jgi:hypothetical protein
MIENRKSTAWVLLTAAILGAVNAIINLLKLVNRGFTYENLFLVAVWTFFTLVFFVIWLKNQKSKHQE